jgi:hypothetical protein
VLYRFGQALINLLLDAISLGNILNTEDAINEESEKKGEEKEGKSEFPGFDPSKAPKGFEWRGKPGSKPGSKDGNWYNPKTGESLRPDLEHPKPIGPHWDYRDPSGNWWRIFPNGSKVPKQ